MPAGKAGEEKAPRSDGPGASSSSSPQFPERGRVADAETGQGVADGTRTHCTPLYTGPVYRKINSNNRTLFIFFYRRIDCTPVRPQIAPGKKEVEKIKKWAEGRGRRREDFFDFSRNIK